MRKGSVGGGRGEPYLSSEQWVGLRDAEKGCGVREGAGEERRGLTLGIYISGFPSSSLLASGNGTEGILYSTGIWDFFSLTCREGLCPSFSW